ncbi:hypothetical protein DFH09DRAFT_1315656 [Mycena vulgaris]|nr:hypothetical protein DFH09DRAFT_1315656 [Mycena vulgaris]
MNVIAIVALLVPAASALIANPIVNPASLNARGAGGADVLPRICGVPCDNNCFFTPPCGCKC